MLHTAGSMVHDYGPANRPGLASCWIYRRHADQGFDAAMHPGDTQKVDFRYDRLADLVKAHMSDLRG